MVKENTMVLIDSEIKHTAKRLSINLSKTLEDTLRAMVNSNPEDNKTYIKLQEELEVIKENKKELSIKESSLITQLEIIRLKNRKVDDERTSKIADVMQATKRSGVFREMVLDE